MLEKWLPLNVSLAPGGVQPALGPALRLRERQARYRSGHLGELIAGLFLMAKGYRILARRHKNRCGEIDLIAVRGHTVAFVEVKRRRSLEAATAAMTSHQAGRLGRASEVWLAKRARYHAFEQRFDAVFVTPGRWPVHVENGG